MDAAVFAYAIRHVWSRESSYCPEQWLPEVPSIGQCAATAVLAQRIFGGSLVMGEAYQRSDPSIRTNHFWTRVDGRQLDFTWLQFGGRYLCDHGQPVEVGRVVQNDWMAERCATLQRDFVAAHPYMAHLLEPDTAP
jgi:hypothetical protein